MSDAKGTQSPLSEEALEAAFLAFEASPGDHNMVCQDAGMQYRAETKSRLRDALAAAIPVILDASPEWRLMPAVATDEMLRASLATERPGMFRKHLRHPVNGPQTAAEVEDLIRIEERRWASVYKASPLAIEATDPVQDTKYDFRNHRVYNRETGEHIPDDEPVFLFRGRDKLLLHVLREYLRLCMENGSLDQAEKVSFRCADFRAFADSHPDRMRLPGRDRPS